METIDTYKISVLNNVREVTCWYAIYTRPHHEKEVCRKLKELNISCYLPLQTTLRQWSDRKKKVSIPLFACYVFVNISFKDYYRVLSIPGVIRYITFEGKAVAIPEKQIRLVKDFLDHDIQVEVIQDLLYLGASVQISAGPLTGVSGELIDFAGKKRVLIRIKELNKCMAISVPLNLLRLVG